MMQGNNRADAVYAVVSTQASFSKLTDAEKGVVQANLRTIFGADLAYIVGNAQVNPSTLTDPGGALVATTGSPTAQTGTVTSATTITGLGSLS